MSSPVEPAHSLFGKERYPLDVFFKPRSVAVIGATEAEGSVGRTTLFNLISSPFGGTVYPVNPKRTSVLGMRSYANVKDVPEPIELAIIVTPAATVPGIIAECVEAQVQGAMILAAGFREMGPRGEELERQVLREAHKGSLRILGPNSLGVMCPTSGLNATFANGMARQGSVAFLSQSGALCNAVLDWSENQQTGFSAFVSVGSMADLGWGELIDYLANDPRTRSILLYMESMGDTRAFVSAAREVALSKPIIVIKAGSTAEGARAAASHTGAMTGSDEVVDAALRRCGVLRVQHLSDLFYMADVLSKQPRPQGNRLTMVTNAGGPAVLAADTLIRGGGALSTLAPETMEALRQMLPPEWSRGNPVDLLGDAKPERYAKALQCVTEDPNSDGFLVVLAPQAATDPVHTAEQVKSFARLRSKPVLASWMGGPGVAAGAGILQAAGIPVFPYPDTAVRMFLYMWAYQENLRALYETPQPSVHGEDDELRISPGSAFTTGSFVDPDFGPVVYAETATGQRVVGLPPLTSTLAGLMLKQLPGCQDEDPRPLVRAAEIISSDPSLRSTCAIRPYPVEYSGTWSMKNGEEVTIRPIRPEDEPMIAAFHQTLSERTVYFRYLSTLKLSTRVAHERLARICFIDYARQMVLVVERQNPENETPEIIAVGRLHKDWQAYSRGRHEAEFALVVGDRCQGLGLGKELLRRLSDIGRREGVEVIYGEISAENSTMQKICRSMGFQLRREIADSTLVARLRLN